MKKTLLFVVVTVLVLIAVCAVQAAEEKVVLTISAAPKSVNGGMPFDITVKSSAAPVRDLLVTVTGPDGQWQATLRQGETSCLVRVETAVAAKRASVKYQLMAGEGYTVDKNASRSVTICTLPRFDFYQPINVARTDREASVMVVNRNSGAILTREEMFELRDETGSVLAERVITSGASRVQFSFSVDDEYIGGHEISVWWNGFCVSGTPAVLAVDNVNRTGRFVKRVETDEMVMSITMDCAYGDTWTQRLLDLYDQYGVKVTVFMTGQWAEGHPEHVKDIVARGHEVGNHSYYHPHMTQISRERAWREIMRTSDLIEEIGGVRPVLYRPPYGEYNTDTNTMAVGANCATVTWTASSRDSTVALTPDDVIKYATKDYGPGYIILFHNAGLGTYEAMTYLIPFFQEQGYRLVTVSELIQLGTPVNQ